jgi:pyruvate kinase
MPSAMSDYIALRRTKIVATLGPATDIDDELEKLLQAGVDACRLNFSHGKADDHIARAKKIRQISANLAKEVAIIADLQGPKIRVSRFKEGTVYLKEGETFILDVQHSKDAGDETIVGVDYPNLHADVKAKDRLLLDDGRLVLEVIEVKGTQILTTVIVGGKLSNNKGINRQGGGLTAPALTDKDKEDLKTAVALGADYVAISFPRSAQDMQEAKALIQAAGGKCGVIAKIERAEALDVIDEIIHASDALMVARGDLGVEIGDSELPQAQKYLIHRCRALNKPVITATQMMESMIDSSIPTRAEVFDVANAVLDGTDAVMLSAETASGKHPAKVVEAMARVCVGAEKHRGALTSGHRVECRFEGVEEVIAMSAMYAANRFSIRGIIALTESGITPLLMSRIRSGIPIFALTRNIATERKMAIYRGVYPMNCAKEFDQIAKDDTFACEILKENHVAKKEDYVIITHGDLAGQAGGTNTLRIIQVK